MAFLRPAEKHQERPLKIIDINEELNFFKEWLAKPFMPLFPEAFKL